MPQRICRVRTITAEGFRGFVKAKTLDTDADIVLVTGPNGFGKTSLVDALCLALTGHYYKERVPVISVGRTDCATVAIEALMEDGTQDKLVATVSGPNEHVDWDAGSWRDVPADHRKLAVRAGFLSQDVLHHLFEEQDAEVLLKDFLVETPVSISEIVKTVDATRKAVRKRISELQMQHQWAEHSTADSRTRRPSKAQTLESVWNLAWQTTDARSLYPQLSRFPSLVSGEPPLMRHDWLDRINLFAERCAESLGESKEPMSFIGNLNLILRTTVRVDREIESLLVAREIELGHVSGLLDRLADTDIVLRDSDLHALQGLVDSLERDTRVLTDEMARIQAVERHFQTRSASGAGLVDVLATLSEMGSEWLNAPPTFSPDLGVPIDVINWLKLAISDLEHYSPSLHMQLAEFQRNLALRRTETSDQLAQAETQLRAAKQRISDSQQVLKLASRDSRFGEAVAQLLACGSTTVTGSILRNRMGIREQPTRVTANPLDEVSNATKSWMEMEIEYEKAQRTSAADSAYIAAKADLDALDAALDAEFKQGTSVVRNVEIVPADLITAFSNAITNAASNFRPVRGILPVRLHESRDRGKSRWIIGSSDGRSLNCFSTGQKAQLAISITLALNASVRSTVWFDVMAFDDFTTALDMNQIPGLSGLLRQLAYGSGMVLGTDASSTRRQLFIVSHHEEMTNRLLDFLLPPAGRSMRILNFVGWDPDHGPDVRQLAVMPGASAESERERLANLLRYRFDDRIES
jgi:DNA repair exonuclease SbcCD ATPase subunit